MGPCNTTSSSTSRPSSSSFHALLSPNLYTPSSRHIQPATTTMAEADDKVPRFSTTSQPVRASFESVSPGVARIEATTEHLTTANRACILFGVLLAAWAYGLDSTLRTTFQPLAVDGLHAHSMLATVTVTRAVIGAAAQVSDIRSEFRVESTERKLMTYSPQQQSFQMSLGELKSLWSR
jgi:hypothetical protein